MPCRLGWRSQAVRSAGGPGHGRSRPRRSRHDCRIRWEIRNDIHEAFPGLVRAIICWRRLTRLWPESTSREPIRGFGYDPADKFKGTVRRGRRIRLTGRDRRPYQHPGRSRYRQPVELRQLEAFVSVATELHFGRAAERLHVSAPTLSELIRRLERELGTPLFTRTTRRVAMTSAGEELLARASSSSTRWPRRPPRSAVSPEETPERCGWASPRP